MRARMHDNLIQAGFAHKHFDANMHDDGDAENGPHLFYEPEFDIYEDFEVRMIFDQYGALVVIEERDHDREAYQAAMFAEMYGE